MVQDNYTVLHCHTMLSNATTTIDSVTTFQDYVDRAKECGMTALAISEHGSIFEWYHKKCAIESAGMKYIHAVEAYITESLDTKLRDNYHCLLIALNYDGVKEINALVSSSFNRDDGHYYYSPRITYSDLKSTSNNIIICTACLGGILNKGNDNIRNDFIEFLIENKHRCYLEIQHHLVDEQVIYNKKLIELSTKYNIPLVATTDTHSLNEKHKKGRSILQKSKNIYFEDEDGWDLTFKTYDELCLLFEKQGIDSSIYLQALDNTNAIADMVQPFELDKSTKYPKIYDDSLNVFKQKINNAYKENPYVKSRYSFNQVKQVIHDEMDAYEKTKSIDFMLLQSYLREWEKDNGIQCGYGRGSVSGSLIAYLLNVTQMDSLKFGLNFFRFMNPSRVTNCDIDTDYHSVDREKVKYFLLHDHMNLDNIQCSEIVTFNTIALKGAIRDVGRALEMSLDEVSDICDRIEQNEELLRQSYPQLFEYVDIVNGTVVSIGSHPSGVLVTDKNIATDIGCCTLSTSQYPVSMLNMKELDALMYVKLDILGLDNLGVINETCKLLNIERLTPDNVDLEDENVWKSIREDTTLIFQWESDSAQAYLKRFMSDSTIKKVKQQINNFSYIKWFSFGNGLIRPACSDYRNEVADGIFYDNHFKELDEFLAPTMGHVTMQEDIMQFLVKFCGYSQAESDTVRRGIAKKYGTEKLLPEIERRFIEYSSTHYNITAQECEEVIKPFLQTILQASAYAFSWNHSDSYSCIGYVCGYLRYYYPLEFLTASLNIFKDKEEKTLAISNYANKIGIGIQSPKFCYSKAEYMLDKDNNTIYKGIESIKFMNAKVADELYSMRDNPPKTFFNLLQELKPTSVNSKQLDILIKIDFFDRYGDMNSLLKIVELFNKYSSCKQIKKDKLNDAEIKIVRECSQKESDKMFKDIDNKKLIKLLFDQSNISPSTMFDKIHYQIQLLGYTNLTTPCDDDIYAIQAIELNQWGTPFVTLYQVNSGATAQYKADKRYYNDHPIEMGDIIDAAIREKDKKRKIDTGWETVGSEEVLVAWSKEI